MAGIGFELKKLFSKKGVFASVRAYGYAAIITTGPMVLGIVLILGVMLLCSLSGAGKAERELLVCMITYDLIASVTTTSVLSMVVTRYTADMLFEERKEEVMPAFWGSAVLMMGVGGLLWLVFLIFSGATLLQGVLLYVLYEELTVVWHAMSFLTAIKDYKGIFTSFAVGIAVALLLGALLLFLEFPALEALLFSVCVGYGVKLVWDVVLLYRYFPDARHPAFAFMIWMDKYKALPWIGFFINTGLFAHLIIMWFSKVGEQVKGLFFGAPYHDVPALLAFLTILVTTVNFVVSVEVNFYPKYRNYSSLYNDRGTAEDISQAEYEMLEVLKTELYYTAHRQLLFTVFSIAMGGYVLEILPLGFNELMKGYFRTLCLGYGLYAIGNMLVLILLYFVDYRGASWASGIFCGCTVLFSAVSLFFNEVYYGFGFLLGSFVFLLFTLLRLSYYTKRLPYYILCSQPLIEEKINGRHTRAAAVLEKLLGDEQES